MKTNFSIVFFLMTLFGCEQNSAQEDFIISENFNGVVIVVFNQDNGKEESFKGNRRKYEIPSDGVLFTQFKKTKGELDHKFYIKNDKNRIVGELPFLPSIEHPDISLRYVLDLYDGNYSYYHRKV
ncbi:DUF6843 domain-containing protein [Winogradskyella flava]|uniref:DUF6843 domain-containing protein n=1 Tax=Winogradskyella flava TaxID=1884876 RepID=A0A842IR04_9FLAO|nr:hypothetical protein [Winogradskyella flava]MBC2844629.1 hypothetical protein [Winogradskyella flava]